MTLLAVTSYEWMKSLHILCVIIWLGTDVGTYLSFQKLLDPSLAVPTRLSMSRLSNLLDQGPRSALVILLMLGITMTNKGGWGLQGDGGRVLAVLSALAGLVWFVGVWYQYWVAHAPAGVVRSLGHIKGEQIFRKVDLYWRSCLAVVLVVVALASLFTRGDGGPIQANWVAWKMLCFAGIVGCGVLIRTALPKIGVAIGGLVQGSTPERETALRSAAMPAIRAVWGIWTFIIVMSALAVFKP